MILFFYITFNFIFFVLTILISWISFPTIEKMLLQIKRKIRD